MSPRRAAVRAALAFAAAAAAACEMTVPGDDSDAGAVEPQRIADEAGGAARGESACGCGAGGALDSDALLVGVNRTNALSAAFVPGVMDVPLAYRAQASRLRPLALGYFIGLADAAAAGAGRTIDVGSAYRSFCVQCQLFDSYAAQFGPEAAGTFSARAGHSEHQLGTTIDIVDAGGFIGGPYDIPGTADADPALYAWLDDHAWEHGFINSYPPDDADGGDRFASRTYQVTGYIPEPWHWRFVGRRAALVHRRLVERVHFRVSSDELIQALHESDHPLAEDLIAVMGELHYTPAALEEPHPDDELALARALE